MSATMTTPRRSKRTADAIGEKVEALAKVAATDVKGQKIKAELEAELGASGTHSLWTGFADELLLANVALTGHWATYRMDAATDVKERVQIVGKAHGCHSCRGHPEADRDQPWTADHCPPTELPAKARELLGTSATTHLFPQCKPCSDKQSGLVTFLSGVKPAQMATVLANLGAERTKLLKGTKVPDTTSMHRNCIAASTTGVSPSEGLAIQILGSNVALGGCHTCGKDFPCPNYIADHVVPKFLVTEGFRQLFEVLGIVAPPLRFRPQCQVCSNGQGGGVSALSVRAREYGRSIGIVFMEE